MTTLGANIAATLRGLGIEPPAADPAKVQALAGTIAPGRDRRRAKATELEARYAREDMLAAIAKYPAQAGFPARAVDWLSRNGEPKYPEPVVDRIVAACLDARMAVLLGDRGRGKTLASVAAGLRLCMAGARVKYAKVADYIADLRHRCWTEKEMAESAWLARESREVPVLILDEWQERGDTDSEAALLTRIIDHRYDRIAATVLVTNLTPAEFARRMPASIVSRLHECGESVVFGWGSYRRSNP